MNNRYFIRISLYGYKYKPQITIMDWYDNPDKLVYNMNMQFGKAVYELSEKRGRYMRKLERKGVDWFKDKVKDGLFYCDIEVIRFNHSFDNHGEFKQWLKDNDIISGEWKYMLPGDYDNRKALQEYATDYYIDIYDCDFNKTDSLSCVYGECEEHRRSCIDPVFKLGDIISYQNCGNYKVLGYPQKYNSLYWHDGFICAHNIDTGDTEYAFDWPEYLERR